MLVAAGHAAFGDGDRAFESLDLAFERREGALVFFPYLPWFRELRDDPRFTDLLDRIGLPQQTR